MIIKTFNSNFRIWSNTRFRESRNNLCDIMTSPARSVCKGLLPFLLFSHQQECSLRSGLLKAFVLTYLYGKRFFNKQSLLDLCKTWSKKWMFCVVVGQSQNCNIQKVFNELLVKSYEKIHSRFESKDCTYGPTYLY